MPDAYIANNWVVSLDQSGGGKVYVETAGSLLKLQHWNCEKWNTFVHQEQPGNGNPWAEGVSYEGPGGNK